MLTWQDQLIEATSVNAGDIADATCMDIFLHVLAFPFKVLFALVPPPSYAGGWLTFIIALGLIGLLTAIVGDLAAIFGCLVGLKDSITAITLVALGTSLPDTFASRLAAVSDSSADNAIGNVTGSNSVNVFLGLGLPWAIAAIYHASKGNVFHVPRGSLAFRCELGQASSIRFAVCSSTRSCPPFASLYLLLAATLATSAAPSSVAPPCPSGARHSFLFCSGSSMFSCRHCRRIATFDRIQNAPVYSNCHTVHTLR